MEHKVDAASANIAKLNADLATANKQIATVVNDRKALNEKIEYGIRSQNKTNAQFLGRFASTNNAVAASALVNALAFGSYASYALMNNKSRTPLPTGLGYVCATGCAFMTIIAWRQWD